MIVRQGIDSAIHALLSVAEGWQGAYRVAIMNALVFLSLSLAVFALDPESVPVILIPPAIFFVGATTSFILMVRSGGAFAVIAWFVLGAGVYFGLGTVIGGLDPDPRMAHYVSVALLCQDLIRVNLLNASSVAIVLLVAAPLANERTLLMVGRMVTFDEVYRIFYGIFPFVLVVSLIVSASKFIFFPLAGDLLVRSILGAVSLILPFCILLVGALWPRLTVNLKVGAAAAVCLELLNALLLMSKFQIMATVLPLVLGSWIGRRGMRRVSVSLAALVAFYLAIAYVNGTGRAHPDFDSDQSAIQRLAILKDVVLGDAPEVPTDYDIERQSPGSVARLSMFDIQSFLIEQYERGEPGTSLDDFWVAAIPRVLWSEKPIVTRFNVELHALFWNTGTTSALAPTYNGEAYWNLGPLGLVLVSVLLGLEFGWFTRRWHMASRGRDPAFFLIAFPSAIWASYVETWIAASYIGGFLTFNVIWLVARAVFNLQLSGRMGQPGQFGRSA